MKCVGVPFAPVDVAQIGADSEQQFLQRRARDLEGRQRDHAGCAQLLDALATGLLRRRR